MRVISNSCIALFFAITIGCGTSEHKLPDFGGEDGKQIADLVEGLNDSASRLNELKAVFASGKKLTRTDTQRYSAYVYALTGTDAVTVSGDNATGMLVLEKGGNKVEKEWTFVKEGDKWKIKDAPLP